MFTPIQSLRIKGLAGDPLPEVFPGLPRFLRGQLGLICAGPGVGKSAFVLTYALKAKVPTLYFSADSDSFTQVSRSVSILAGQLMADSSSQVRNNTLTKSVLADLEVSPIRYTYQASPSLDDIESSMKAYDEVYGDFPELVIVDNITNVRLDTGDDDPFSGLEGLMDYLHDMARKTSSCVLGLHHVTGGYNDANRPIPLSGVKGQIARVPELVLTLHRVSSEFGLDTLNVSAVKDRYGRADPSGYTFTKLAFDGERMQIG